MRTATFCLVVLVALCAFITTEARRSSAISSCDRFTGRARTICLISAIRRSDRVLCVRIKYGSRVRRICGSRSSYRRTRQNLIKRLGLKRTSRRSWRRSRLGRRRGSRRRSRLRRRRRRSRRYRRSRVRRRRRRSRRYRRSRVRRRRRRQQKIRLNGRSRRRLRRLMKALKNARGKKRSRLRRWIASKYGQVV